MSDILYLLQVRKRNDPNKSIIVIASFLPDTVMPVTYDSFYLICLKDYGELQPILQNKSIPCSPLFLRRSSTKSESESENESERQLLLIFKISKSNFILGTATVDIISLSHQRESSSAGSVNLSSTKLFFHSTSDWKLFEEVDLSDTSDSPVFVKHLDKPVGEEFLKITERVELLSLEKLNSRMNSEFPDKSQSFLSEKNDDHKTKPSGDCDILIEDKRSRKSRSPFDVTNMSYDDYCAQHYNLAIEAYRQSRSLQQLAPGKIAPPHITNFYQGGVTPHTMMGYPANANMLLMPPQGGIYSSNIM